MSKNKAILIGRVGKDPEIKTFDNGGQIANFFLATSSRWKDKATGEKKERTEWHNIVINGKLSEVVQKYVRKGMLLSIEGEIRYREYEKDGIKRYATDIVCKEMVMLSKSEERETAQANEEIAHTNNTSVSEDLPDDLPF